MNDDLIDRLRLVRTPGIGPITYRQLVQRFGSAGAALDALPDLARRGGGKAPRIASRDEAEREIAAVEKLGAQYLVLGQGLYPNLLAALEDAPPLIMAKGELALLDRPAVAMVGARNASAAACRFARGLAHDLGGEGLVVVSGLARGIDSAAHDGALETGTIAVIAGGIDVAYPPENAERQNGIAGRGLLIAEMPPGTEPRARHFPYRNRIIAGIAAGTVVVEAAPRSGSLITARLAAEAGREVMAVPGSPLDPRAQGCNQLIRDGATLVQTAADVVEMLSPSAIGRVAEPPKLFTPVIAEEAEEGQRQAIESLLGPVAVAVDGAGPAVGRVAGGNPAGAARARSRRAPRSARGRTGQPRRLTVSEDDVPFVASRAAWAHPAAGGDQQLAVDVGENRILVIKRLAREQHLGNQPVVACCDIEVDVRGTNGAFGNAKSARRDPVGAGHDRDESIIALRVGRHHAESLKGRVERIGARIAGVGVAARGIGLPDFDPRAGQRRALAVENSTDDFDRRAQRLLADQR